MPADGQKVLAAVPVAVFEDIGRGPPLAPDAKSFDVCIPDGLARGQFSYGFEGNSTDRQLDTKNVTLRRRWGVLIGHCYTMV